MKAVKEKATPTREPRVLKNDIKYKVTLDEDQKKLKSLYFQVRL